MIIRVLNRVGYRVGSLKIIFGSGRVNFGSHIMTQISRKNRQIEQTKKLKHRIFFTKRKMVFTGILLRKETRNGDLRNVENFNQCIFLTKYSYFHFVKKLH